jgi:hypothetical protein
MSKTKAELIQEVVNMSLFVNPTETTSAMAAFKRNAEASTLAKVQEVHADFTRQVSAKLRAQYDQNQADIVRQRQELDELRKKTIGAALEHEYLREQPDYSAQDQRSLADICAATRTNCCEASRRLVLSTYGEGFNPSEVITDIHSGRFSLPAESAAERIQRDEQIAITQEQQRAEAAAQYRKALLTASPAELQAHAHEQMIAEQGRVRTQQYNAEVQAAQRRDEEFAALHQVELKPLPTHFQDVELSSRNLRKSSASFIKLLISKWGEVAVMNRYHGRG